MPKLKLGLTDDQEKSAALLYTCKMAFQDEGKLAVFRTFINKPDKEKTEPVLEFVEAFEEITEREWKKAINDFQGLNDDLKKTVKDLVLTPGENRKILTELSNTHFDKMEEDVRMEAERKKAEEKAREDAKRQKEIDDRKKAEDDRNRLEDERKKAEEDARKKAEKDAKNPLRDPRRGFRR